jgi:peptidoglycan hydrolase FlgJ
MHSLTIAKLNSAELPLDRFAAHPNLSEQDKVAEATRQFEAVLLRQILKDARKPVFPSPYESQSTVSDIYNDMIADRLAESISRSGSFGLARALQSELAARTTKPPAPAQPALPDPPRSAVAPESKPIRTKLFQ